MASWKKIIVSGSNAHLTAVTASNLTNDNLLIAGAGGEIEGSGLTYNGTLLNLGSANIETTGVVSGSQFSGSFYGDGSALTGIATNLDIAGSDLSQMNIDLLDRGVQFTTGSNASGFTFTTGSQVSFGGKNYTELVLNAPQNLSTTGTPTFGSGSFNGITVNDLNITGIDGGVQLQAGSFLRIDAANVEFINGISSSLTPTTHQAFSLGTSSNKWLDLHVREGNIVTANVNTLSGSGATLTLIGDAIDVDAAGELSIDAADAITITSTNSTVSVEGTTFDGNNVTIPGDLVVNGDTVNVNTTNLDIEDRYILLNSGSSTIGDSGIVFGGSTGVQSSGSALVWDGSYNSNDGRLAVVGAMGSTDTGNVTPSYHVAGVYEGNETNAATAQADHPGNIRIENGDIFIYV